MDVIDLRSDVKTLPSEGMLRAMCTAPLGDEQEREDPTVCELEERLQSLLGLERALFVPSATMANQIALLTQIRPGDEVLAHEHSHIFRYEAGGPAALAGAVLTGLAGSDGQFDGAAIRRVASVSESEHRPRTRLVSIENTHNTSGGRAWSLAGLDDVHDTCDELGLLVHLDGSRLFNAAVALDVPVARLSSRADSVAICFSKGLGAPAGAALVGTAEALADARRIRQRLGGSLRQAGMLAAAACYGLEHNIAQLAQDHAAALELATRLFEAGVAVDPIRTETNFVLLDLAELPFSREEILPMLAAAGVLWSKGHAPSVIRAVTHLDVSSGMIREAAERTSRVLGECARG